MLLASSVSAADFDKVGKLVQPLIDGEAMVGCVVGIVEGDKQEVRGYGSIHRGKGDEPNGDTIYEIGSVTKTFTCTLLADMAARGEVKLDQPLQDFMPKGVKLHLYKDKPIRLVDIASQTSGLPRMPDNFAPKDTGNPYADYTPRRMFDFVGRHELRRAPGEYEYSNLGMGLLGYVLSQKLGKTYEQAIVERIADPLKMNDTRITLSEEQRKRLAPGYDAALVPAKNWDLNALAGAGGIRSTANDLMKLVAASLGDDKQPVVAAIHEAWNPRYGKKGEIGVGLGWHIARDGVTRFHGGQTGGYTADIFVFQPKKLGVVVVCNTATDKTSALAEKIIQSQLGMTPAPIAVRKAIKVTPEILKNYEGTYALSILFTITIKLENGKLMAQATGQDKAQIFPESETRFFYKIVDAQIDFEKGKDGKIEKLVLHQAGKDVPGMKLPSLPTKK
jgi:CubicO group peptidase (beta-lactamase class C family)